MYTRPGLIYSRRILIIIPSCFSRLSQTFGALIDSFLDYLRSEHLLNFFHTRHHISYFISDDGLLTYTHWTTLSSKLFAAITGMFNSRYIGRHMLKTILKEYNNIMKNGNSDKFKIKMSIRQYSYVLCITSCTLPTVLY